MAGSMKEKGILRAQAVARENTKRFAARPQESRHGSGEAIKRTTGRTLTRQPWSGKPGGNVLRREAILRSKRYPAPSPGPRRAFRKLAAKTPTPKPRRSLGGRASARLQLSAAKRGIKVGPAKAVKKVERSMTRGRTVRSPLSKLKGAEKALGKQFKKTAARSFAKGVARKALRFAGPVGVALGAAEGAHQIGKAAYHGAKAVTAYRDLDVSRKKSKAKYGTLARAARTRRKMTGK